MAHLPDIAEDEGPPSGLHMDRRTRICIWVILIGLGNFVAYTVSYMFLGGEAATGTVYFEDQTGRRIYQLHPERWPDGVSFGTFLYSGIHSISIWPTVGAVMLAMLTLAKERIASSMRSTILRGRTLITILATVITFVVMVVMIWFILQFSRTLACPRTLPPVQPAISARLWR